MKFKSIIALSLLLSLPGLTACSSAPAVLLPTRAPINLVARNNVPLQAKYTPIEKPDYVYSKGIYPQYISSFKKAVNDFMSERVSKSEIASHKFGGWRGIDDAQIEIEFYGIEDMELFKTQILPDLLYYISERV